MENKHDKKTTGRLVAVGFSQNGFSTTTVEVLVDTTEHAMTWEGQDKNTRLWFYFTLIRNWDLEGKTFEVGPEPGREIIVVYTDEHGIRSRGMSGSLEFIKFNIPDQILKIKANFIARNEVSGEEKKIEAAGDFQGFK